MTWHTPRASAPARWLPLIALALFVLAALPARAFAQEGTISGVVTAAGTNEPLPGVQVFVVGGSQRTLSDERGRFRLVGLGAGTATIEGRRIGYRSGQVTARVGDAAVRLPLQVNATSLEAVVVTGTAGATEKRAIGNAVGTINAAQVTEIAPIQNVQSLLNGRAPGVVFQPATGGVGNGGRIRIRGNASITLGNEPLLYVDGVRVNNNPASGPENQGFGSATISRVNDINPEDIESLEILRGPAAAALYGTEASAGVIQIITKKGRNGAPQWSGMARGGRNYLPDPASLFPVNYGLVNGKLDSIAIVRREDAAGRPIFQNGHQNEFQLGVSGGSERATYFASGNALDASGAEASNYQRRLSGRANIGVTPSEKFSIHLSSGYSGGPTRLASEGGNGGRVWSTVLATPLNLAPVAGEIARRGFHSGTPEQYDILYNFLQNVTRFTGSATLEHHPASWLNHRLTVGIDQTGEENVNFTPRVDTLRNSAFGDEALGYKGQKNIQTQIRTFDYNANVLHDLGTALRTTTSVGAQYYRNRITSIFAEGYVFPAQGLSSITATTQDRATSEGYTEDATLGVYVQEQLAWHERLYFTAALRSDDNSAFGKDFNRVVYPKYSASWVVSEEPFFPRLSFLDQLRFRAAYGEAGKAPSTYASLRAYTSAVGPGGTTAVTPSTLGNSIIGPERGKEYELGFDANGLGDRAGIEFTYYDKRTKDAIIDRSIPPSSGFLNTDPNLGSLTQPFNAGLVTNKGVELLLRATPWRAERATVDLTFTLSRNDNRLVSLGIPGQTFLSVGTNLRQQEGYPLGSYFARRVVSAQFDPVTQKAINVLCDDGSNTGATVSCANAPLVYFGRVTPPTEGSFSSTVTFLKNWRLYGLMDFKHGQVKLNGNARVRCLFFGGRCRENFVPADYDPVRIAQIQGGTSALVGFLIEDASFTKFRELTLAYDLPTQLLGMLNVQRASLALSGRNLHTWTSYSGLEPEAMFNGGSRGGFAAFEQAALPQLRQWTITANFTF
jgi:TonB-dependent SusC/RagA subfamily outer membrane receptor